MKIEIKDFESCLSCHWCREDSGCVFHWDCEEDDGPVPTVQCKPGMYELVSKEQAKAYEDALIARAEAEDEAASLRAEIYSVRTLHNGYDPESGIEEPTSLAEAVQSLISEAEALGKYESNELYRAAIWSDDSTPDERGKQEPEDAARFTSILRAEVARLRKALDGVCNLGGNLPDESLTDKTGPNDAAYRGWLYCDARRLARAALEGRKG